jgi:hypothetical protein
MKDNLGIASELDRLFPTEKLRDPKAKRVRQETPQKRREGRRPEGIPPEDGEPKKEAPEGSSEDQDSGKILDILI